MLALYIWNHLQFLKFYDCFKLQIIKTESSHGSSVFSLSLFHLSHIEKKAEHLVLQFGVVPLALDKLTYDQTHLHLCKLVVSSQCYFFFQLILLDLAKLWKFKSKTKTKISWLNIDSSYVYWTHSNLFICLFAFLETQKFS